MYKKFFKTYNKSSSKKHFHLIPHAQGDEVNATAAAAENAAVSEAPMPNILKVI